MIIKYEFITGEKVEIEASSDLGNTIVRIEKETMNSDRRETRRHQSLNNLEDNLDGKTDVLIDSKVNIEEELINKLLNENLHNAIKKLKPSEQELIYKLYLDKHPLTQAQYARDINISDAAMWKRIQRIRNKLKKLI